MKRQNSIERPSATMDREAILKLAIDSFHSYGLKTVQEAAQWIESFLTPPAPPIEVKKKRTWSAARREAARQRIKNIHAESKLNNVEKVEPEAEKNYPVENSEPDDVVRAWNAPSPPPPPPPPLPPPPLEVTRKQNNFSYYQPTKKKHVFPSGVDVDKFISERGIKTVLSPEQVAEYLRTKGRRVVLKEAELDKSQKKHVWGMPKQRRRIIMMNDIEVSMTALYTEANMLRTAEGLPKLDIPTN